MDKTKLLGRALAEADVPTDVGTFRVRAISRSEVHRLNDVAAADGTDAAERWLLRTAVVDPDLSEDETEQWRNTAPGHEIDAVLTAILRLSGLDKAGDAPKSGQVRR